MAASMQSIFAGGLLTHTNQNVVFLRNPARDAAIGIDGVYSNPAGVAFLDEGLHLSFTLQNALQIRTVKTDFPLFNYNMNNPGSSLHEYEGEANAPIIPSVQAAYNTGRWSFQFAFAVTGGGGKCIYNDGLGSFEQFVGGSIYSIANNPQLQSVMAAAGHKMGNGYAYDSYMKGEQYYFGITAGAAYRLSDNVSVYGGLRVLYGTANYSGYLKNIQVQCVRSDGSYTMENASNHFAGIAGELAAKAAYLGANGQAEAANQMTTAANAAQMLSYQTSDLTLDCNQTGVGIAPIIGVDYKTGRLNLAAKYEFQTRMRLENSANNSENAANVEMVSKYADGVKVAEDTPALLTIGAQYEITPALRVMAGWHHYFDVNTEQYTKDMLGDTNELLLGVEWDINDAVQVSLGGQRTMYAFEDAGMTDISHNVSSYAVGFGVGVMVAKDVRLNAAYFHNFYGDYDMVSNVSGMDVKNSFTRANRVFGLGVDVKF